MPNGIKNTHYFVNKLQVKTLIGSYSGTYAYVVLNLISMLIMTSIFSKYWSSDSFLEFTKILRYAGFIVALSSFSIGFSVIKKSSQGSLHNDIYPAAFNGVLFSSLLLGGGFTLIFNIPIYVVIWIVSASVFHVYISSVRYESPKDANISSILLKVVLLLIVVFICLYTADNIQYYFFIYGSLVFFFVLLDSVRRKYSVSPFDITKNTIIELYLHAFSRMIDNSARLMFHIMPVWVANIYIGGRAAGIIALTLLISKALESSMQPLIMHIHSNRVKNSSSLSIKWLIILLLSLVFLTIMGAFFLRYFGELVISLWLTPDYFFIIPFLYITIWSIPCIIILQLLKGNMEGHSKKSPFVYINLFFIASSIPLYILLSQNIYEILLVYVGGYILRLIASFFVYMESQNKEAKASS